MKKIWILGMSSALCMALFTGCAGNADTMPQPGPTVTTAPMTTTAPTNTVGPTVSLSPQTTDNALTDLLPDMTADTAAQAGVNTVQDAKRVSEQVSEEIDKLSEIEDAQAVVTGTSALVGVTYDSQYQSGLDDRLRDMITERVEMIDKAVTTVHVTDEPEAVRKIESLYERLDDGSITFAELQTEVLDIGSGMTEGMSPAPTAGTSAGKK